ncbi:MAG TPA: protein YgfX [Gammaproteobacteria bacterium]|nr:protein YgfX [Gammaproteobacteria bacterium]
MFQLQLKPSRSFFILMLFILLGALVSIYCCFLPYYIQLFLVLLLMLEGRRLLYAWVLLRGQKTIIGLSCQNDKIWLLKERSGKEYPAFLGADSTRFPWFCLLRFQPLWESGRRGQRKKTKVLVFYDSVDPLVYRRLQVKLGTTTIHEEDSLCL